MTDKTKELLRQCKEAGYEIVTVLVRDEKVPLSEKLKSGAWFGDMPLSEDLPNTPIKAICGYPERIDTKGWPEMWSIIRSCGLTAGLEYDGLGNSDSMNIHPVFLNDLTPGCYEL